jgi:cell division protein FtsB
MADENGNGRRPILTRETLVPWGFSVAFASLAWFGATKYGDLEKQITLSSYATNEKLAEQSRAVALQIQALTFTVEAQGRDLDKIKTSVDALTRSAGK